MEKKRFLKLFLIAAVTIAIWNIPAPAGLEVETWHIVALYLGLLLGLVIKPFSEPIITLIIVGIAAMFMDTSILLKGYGNNMAWFIAMVTIVCTAFVKTGLGRRIAYNLLLKSGKNTLSLGYIMVFTDLVLSPATGSNSSRTSIIYPIFQNIAEGTGSSAKNAPRKLGAYLTVLMYASGNISLVSDRYGHQCHNRVPDYRDVGNYPYLGNLVSGIHCTGRPVFAAGSLCDLQNLSAGTQIPG